LKLEPLIIYSLFSCVLFSSLSLILSPQIHSAHKIGMALGLASAFFYQYFQRRLSRWFFNSLSILALASALIYGIWFAEYPIQAAIYFLGYLILLRMFELETLRDYRLALILSLFEISAGSLMMVQLRFLLIFIGWLFSALFSLTLLTLSSRTSVKKNLPAPDRLLSLLLSAGMVALALGFLLFFFLPRVGISLIAFQIGAGRAWSGYSTQIRLGEVSELLENRAPVLRGRLIDHSGPIDGLKWRMRALEYYENNTWQDLSRAGENFPVYFNQPTTIDLRPPRGIKLQQEIYLEPDIGADLPAGGWVYAYLLPFKFRNFSCSSNHYCTLPYPAPERIHYLAYSVLPEYSELEIRTSLGLVPEVLKEKELGWVKDLLQLPRGSEPICKLAQEIAGAEPDPLKKLSLLQNFFAVNFKYSLTNLPAGKNPVEEFLFRARQGNCEYFASAGVLMLRCLGIPGRMAVGFLAGEWNPYQNYYLVRQSDAHTWVEIYLPGLGLMEFDPTPPGARQERQSASWLWKIIDPMVFRWNRWVVEFSVQDQIRGWRRMEAESYRLRYSWRISAPEIRFWIQGRPILALLILLLALGAVWLSFWLSPQRKAERICYKNLKPEQKQAVKIYREMFKILSRKGWPGNPATTGLELAEKCSCPREASELIKSITALYYQVRFGERTGREEDFKRAEDALRLLKRKIIPRK